MAKEKNTKVTENYLNNIILKKLKRVIIICLAACLVYEFTPDIIDIYELFGYCDFITFLQHHKDFLINVNLGCLGSAVISYLMLIVQFKTKENEKKENLNIYFKKIVSTYWDLIRAIMITREITDENKKLQISIEKFMSYYEESDICRGYFAEYIEVLNNKLIPLVNEVEEFIFSFDQMVNKEDIVRLYNQNVYNEAVREIYDKFYGTLLKELKLQEANEMFTKKFHLVSITTNNIIEKLDNQINEIENIMDIRKRGHSRLKYSYMIMKLLMSENLKKIKENS